MRAFMIVLSFQEAMDTKSLMRALTLLGIWIISNTTTAEAFMQILFLHKKDLSPWEMLSKILDATFSTLCANGAISFLGSGQINSATPIACLGT